MSYLSSSPLFLKEKKFSPATGISPSGRRLASWTLPLTIWYFIEGRPQTKQVEGFITFITQDQLVIFTCKNRDHTTLLAEQQILQLLSFLSKDLFLFMFMYVSGSICHMCSRACKTRREHWLGSLNWISSQLPNLSPPEKQQAFVRSHPSLLILFLSFIV